MRSTQNTQNCHLLKNPVRVEKSNSKRRFLSCPEVFWTPMFEGFLVTLFFIHSTAQRADVAVMGVRAINPSEFGGVRETRRNMTS